MIRTTDKAIAHGAEGRYTNAAVICSDDGPTFEANLSFMLSHRPAYKGAQDQRHDHDQEERQYSHGWPLPEASNWTTDRTMSPIARTSSRPLSRRLPRSSSVLRPISRWVRRPWLSRSEAIGEGLTLARRRYQAWRQKAYSPISDAVRNGSGIEHVF